MDDLEKTQIVIAAHKKYRMPKSRIYLPLHVGAAGKEAIGYERDDSGENISRKNPYYCELTGLYWAWKNLDCDYVGMVHYRRYFTVKSYVKLRKCKDNIREKMQCVLDETELEELEKKYDIIVPKKRRYIIETLYSHYSHSHYSEHLDLTREVISKKYQEYLPVFDKVMKSRSGHMFNMFIMKKELMDQYCTWLFDILFEVEKYIDIKRLSPFQGRLYGRISEIIFNAWLTYQMEVNDYKVKEIDLLYMEPINWKRKSKAFLAAKFFHKKYDGSF
jgi:hypothetical protein